MASASAGAPAEHHERNKQATKLLIRVRGTFNPLRVLRPGRTATHLAGVAELVDALVSGTSGGNPVEVQVLSSAPCKQPPRTALYIDCLCILRIYFPSLSLPIDLFTARRNHCPQSVHQVT